MNPPSPHWKTGDLRCVPGRGREVQCTLECSCRTVHYGKSKYVECEDVYRVFLLGHSANNVFVEYPTKYTRHINIFGKLVCLSSVRKIYSANKFVFQVNFFTLDKEEIFFSFPPLKTFSTYHIQHM